MKPITLKELRPILSTPKISKKVNINQVSEKLAKFETSGITPSNWQALKGIKKTIIPKLNMPKPEDFIDFTKSTFERPNEAYENYYKALSQECFDENGKLKKSITDYFDTKKFNLPDKNGKTKPQTLAKFFTDNVETPASDANWENKNLYHATFIRQTAEKIQTEGFDFNKVSRAKYGPGMYLTQSEGEARNYGSSVLSCDVSGRRGHVSSPFYEKMENSNISGIISDDLKIETAPIRDYKIFNANQNFISKILGEYTRNFFVDKLGVDLLTCRVGVVLLNGDSLKIKKIL